MKNQENKGRYLKKQIQENLKGQQRKSKNMKKKFITINKILKN